MLLVHGPPYGVLDKITPPAGGKNVGSPSLRDWIARNEPRLVVCAHIRECYGADRIGSTAVHNVAYLDSHDQHPPAHVPIVIDIHE